MKRYKLSDADLNTLPYEEKTNKHSGSHPMRLYSENDVARLARQKREHLGLPLDTNRNPSSQDTNSDPCFATNACKRHPVKEFGDPSPQVHSIEKHLYPRPKPLILHDYISNDPSEYPSDQIAWGECGNVPSNLIASDACALFNVTRDDIAHLTAESEWVETKTVAMCAVRLHGGLKAHNQLIRDVEKAELEPLTNDERWNRYSADLQLLFKHDPHQVELDPPPTHECDGKCVARLLPPPEDDEDYHGFRFD